jgi:DNA helicase HerA-like ATPase
MRLEAAKSWGLFDPEAPRIVELVKPGAVNIIDVSTFKSALGGQSLREVIVAIVGKRIFEERMKYRKVEEARMITEGKAVSEMPLVWMIIDEAHLFMPNNRESLAKSVLSDWIRVGRQPGLSLVLATQRIDRLSDDAITQADIIIGHRITSYLDIKALSAVRPTYVGDSLDKHLASLPHTRGLAVLLDDVTEKLWVIRVRPRMSWHGGGSATALIPL